jgi:hypothetical protein
MVPSIAGVLICCGLMAAVWFTEVPVVVALIASLAFGSTAIATLPALGGSSPMIYVVFLVGLLASVALRRDIMRNIGTVLVQQPTAWLILFLIGYTVVGAILLPRLFAGETTVFVPVRDTMRIAEVPLVPVGGNITQSLYFVLSALAFFALSVLLLQKGTLAALRKGFFAWAILHVSMGFIDLFGKIAGLGDLLAPIRSATYAMLTNVDIAGFWRIAGGYAEASSFGATTVVLLAFTFTHWRSTRDRFSLALSVVLLVLLVLSTSSTAYGAGGVLGLVLAVSIARAALRNRLQAQDLAVVAGGIGVIVLALGVLVHNDHSLDPFWHLFDTMILDKSSSSSAQERAYWNYRSLATLHETFGLGIGLGSSRASSWVIAVISQLGIIGSIMIGYLTLQIFRGGRLCHERGLDLEARVTARSMRAAAIAVLVTATISGGGADPGIIFFLTLAVLLRLRMEAAQANARQPGLAQWTPQFSPVPRRA